MDKVQAYKLIEETFKRSFDKGRFLNFSRNLLNHIDESEDRKSTWSGSRILAAFKGTVNHYQRLATYTAPTGEKLDILIVYLTKQSKLERARTAIRNFVAHHLDQHDDKEAALVAFVSPSEKQWRLSYVKMEYETVEKKSGKVGVETRLTSARRFSYLVGEGESCHTAQTRFLQLLENIGTDPLLSDIEKAFSVETVTKEFFEKYAGLFEELKDSLEKLMSENSSLQQEFHEKKIKPTDFAKKLMGQIVFLYFLQKKGWLGAEKGKDWGTGPHDFLRQLADGRYVKYENYFNDILEPLFYDTLANDRGNQSWCEQLKCRIPFLNGGLFEPLGDYDWQKIHVLIPNRLFTNKERVDEGIYGTGILDVFDRYNFTVNEAEPLEKEVAIDPEMLGKVFENLIEENLRKGLGSYYTPREIVHYMCQQSLINYLDVNLNKDSNLIPRADIEELVYRGDESSFYEAALLNGAKSYEKKDVPRLPRSVRDNAPLIDESLEKITVCDPAVGSGAFPVGMMAEIVRARTSLTPYFNDVHERAPYYFKRQAIQNCLYGVDIDLGAVEIAKLRLWLSLVVDEEDIKQIQPLPNLDFKIVTGNSLIGFPFKSKKLEQIEQLKDRYFNEFDHTIKAKLKQEIHTKLTECFAASKESLGYEVRFDFRIYFSEIFHNKNGFDVIIGNPPWGAELTAIEKTILKKSFSLIDSSTPNSFAYFIGLAVEIGDGNFSYVLPDSILIKDYAKARKLLKPLLRELHWYQNIRVPDILRPFLNVEHDVCVIISNSKPTNTLLCFTTVYDFNKRNFLSTRWVANKDDMIMEEFDNAFNLMLRNEDLSILQKITRFRRIDEILQCHEGIHTGNAREVLFKLEKENEWCKPLYYGGGAGDEVSNFVSKRNGWYVDYRKELIDKKKGLYASLRDERIFANPKIYITRTGNPFKAFLDENNYASNNFFSLQFKDYNKNDMTSLKVVLSFILASITQYFIRTFAAPRLGDTFVETKILHLLKFRIPELNMETQKKLRQMVDDIIVAKTKNLEFDARVKQREIDSFIYRLYGLTSDEIAVVEKAILGSRDQENEPKRENALGNFQ